MERCTCRDVSADAEKGCRSVYNIHLASTILERLASENREMASAEIPESCVHYFWAGVVLLRAG